MRRLILDMLETRICMASVSGYVYNDLNDNGLHEAGESAFQGGGITAYLDLNGNEKLDDGEPNQLTVTRLGKFEFGNLTPGAYTVRLKLTNPAIIQTDPASGGGRSITLVAEQNGLVEPFGVYIKRRLAGLVYNDLNHNGSRQDGEAPLVGNQTVYIDSNNNSSLDDGEPSAVTNPDGVFFDVMPGTYTLRLLPKTGWIQTQPGDNNGITIVVPVTGNPDRFVFGTYEVPVIVKGKIYGSVWNDLNGDGSRVNTEPPIAGAVVYLDLNRNGVLNTDTEPFTLTNGDGLYSFADLNPGEYLVRQQLPDGWTQTFPLENAGHLVNLASGKIIDGKAFGRKHNEPVVGRISGVYFIDANGNAALDSGETRLASKKIFLDANENNTFDDGETSVLTNAGGEYVFTGLAAGSYHVRAVIPTGFKQTTPLANLTLAAGQNIIAVLIGIKSNETVQLGSIAGLSWSDLNADGIKQLAEPVQVGKTIYIDTNKNGIFDAGEKSTLTNAEGRYKFTNLQPGNYRIRRIVPANFRLTLPTIGYYDITLTTGQNVVEKNFATTERTAATGRVFRDLNGDRKFNDGEIGLPGWTVYIDKNKNGKLDDGERKTTTSANGEWAFKDLFAGSYRIRVVQKDGFQLTVPELKYYDITLTSGQIKTGLLFGEKPITTPV